METGLPGVLEELRQQLSEAKTTAGLIGRALRQGILSLRLPPGATMSEQETARILGVSRTPVREAFAGLAREEMLIVSPQRRTAVAKISLERVRQERFLRESLELAAIGLFFPERDGETLRAMEECIQKQRDAAALKDIRLFIRWDDEFHGQLFEATGNALCRHVLAQNNFDYQRLRYLTSFDFDRMPGLNIAQHGELLRLLGGGSLPEAQDLLRTHLRRLFEEAKTLSQRYPHFFS